MIKGEVQHYLSGTGIIPTISDDEEELFEHVDLNNKKYNTVSFYYLMRL